MKISHDRTSAPFESTRKLIFGSPLRRASDKVRVIASRIRENGLPKNMITTGAEMPVLAATTSALIFGAGMLLSGVTMPDAVKAAEFGAAFVGIPAPLTGLITVGGRMGLPLIEGVQNNRRKR